MTNVNKKIIEESIHSNGSHYIEDCYKAQVLAFAKGEYKYLNELIGKYDIKSVLDVGTGNGGFISGLAASFPAVFFEAVDADKHLINEAQEKNTLKNISFKNLMFDESFPLNRYDMILARFAAEHMPDVPYFINEAYRRLKKNSILVLTEYYIDDLFSENEDWRLFRQKEIEFYVKFGSHPRISTLLPKYMKDAGFDEVESFFRIISPSTAGADAFFGLIRTYAKLYCNLDNSVFNDEIKKRTIQYCDEAQNGNMPEDALLISHTIGSKD